MMENGFKFSCRSQNRTESGLQASCFKKKWDMQTHIPFFLILGVYFTVNTLSSIGTFTSILSRVITEASMPFAIVVVFFGMITPLLST